MGLNVKLSHQLGDSGREMTSEDGKLEEKKKKNKLYKREE